MSDHLPKTAAELTPSSSEIKSDERRGLKVGVHRVSPTSKGDSEDARFLDAFENDLIREMDKTLRGLNLSEEAFEDEQICGNCKEMIESGQIKIETHVQPASSCDHWDAKTRTCWFTRNIGGTVTFVLKANHLDDLTSKVTWKKEFYVRHSKERNEFIIKPGNAMWNIAIGRRNMELRLSPITETDVDFNRFSATVQEDGVPVSQTSNNRVNFQIQVVPIDMGFVYLGETLELNMQRFCSLPYEGISYQWLLQGDTDYSTLPSNMKVSPSGSSVTISELRKQQEGVVACAAYTRFGAFVAKRRFLIRDINENDDISLAVLNHKKKQDSVSGHRQPKLKRSRIRKSTKDIEEMEEVLEDQFGNKKRAAPPSSSLEIGDKENGEYSEMSARRNRQASNQDRGQFVETPNQPNRDFPESIVGGNRRFPESMEEDIFQRRLSPPEVPNSNQRRQMAAAAPDSGGQGRFKYKYMKQSVVPARTSEGNNFPESIARQREGSEAENNAQRKQTKDIILDIERKVFDETQVVNKVLRFMAPCSKDRECSGHALCIGYKSSEMGVCRCLPGYRGDGIFCDKDAIGLVGLD